MAAGAARLPDTEGFSCHWSWKVWSHLCLFRLGVCCSSLASHGLWEGNRAELRREVASSVAWLLPPTHRTTPRAPHGSPRGGRCEIVKALSADAVDRSEVVCLLAFGAAWEADGGGKLVMRRPEILAKTRRFWAPFRRCEGGRTGHSEEEAVNLPVDRNPFLFYFIFLILF